MNSRWYALRAPYLKKIHGILWVAETKIGKDTAKYLKDLMKTPSFRHTGIVNANKETVQWAAEQNTQSTCPLDTCQDCLRWDDQAQTMTVNGIKMMIVFTDGSANAVNTDMLAYAGWGFYLHEGSTQNTGGVLNGKPTTSYRAEVCAVLEVVWRVRHPTCIVSDCKSVCQILGGILSSIAKGEQTWWPDDDGCNDYWETISDILRQNYAPIHITWMPSHLDEDKKKEERDKFIANGGTEEWIRGNCGADDMAKRGAALGAPPEHLLAREKITRTFARAVQRMAVHIWAAEKGLVMEKDADGHEADMEEEMFGLDTADDFNNITDTYQDAFEDLLDATMPKSNDDQNGIYEDEDPWAEGHQLEEQMLPMMLTAAEGNRLVENPTLDKSHAPQVGGCCPPYVGDSTPAYGDEQTDQGRTSLPESQDIGLPESRGADRNDIQNALVDKEDGHCAVLRRIVKCKANIGRLAPYYPIDQSEDAFEVCTDTSTFLTDVDVFNTIQARASKSGKNGICTEWMEPALWCLNSFRWSREYSESDDIVKRRRYSCTYVELACAIDILTGGRCGPKDASFADKAEICKRIWTVASACLKFKTIIKNINDLPTIAPLGFQKMQGLSRRPDLGQWKGLANTVAAMVKFAKAENGALKTKLPRITWIKPCWQPSAMYDIFTKLNNKRKVLHEQEIHPDMVQRNIRMRSDPSTNGAKGQSCDASAGRPGGSQEQARGPEGMDLSAHINVQGTVLGDSTRKHVPRQGPCKKCDSVTTTNIKKGIQVWRNPPMPIPWPDIGPNDALCNRCYFRGMALRKKLAEEQARGQYRGVELATRNVATGIPPDSEMDLCHHGGPRVSGYVQQPGLQDTQNRECQLGFPSRIGATVNDVGSSTPSSLATEIVLNDDRSITHCDGTQRQPQSALILKANRIEYLPESLPSQFCSPAGCCAPGQPTRRHSAIYHGDDDCSPNTDNDMQTSVATQCHGNSSATDDRANSVTDELTKNYMCEKDKIEVVGCKKGRFPALRCGCEECTGNKVCMRNTSLLTTSADTATPRVFIVESGKDPTIGKDASTTGTGTCMNKLGGQNSLAVESDGDAIGTTASTCKVHKRYSKPPRQGPCKKCESTTTTNIKKGVQIWRNPPKPIPWPNIGPEDPICNKCYFKGLALRNKDEKQQSDKSSGQAKRAPTAPGPIVPATLGAPGSPKWGNDSSGARRSLRQEAAHDDGEDNNGRETDTGCDTESSTDGSSPALRKILSAECDSDCPVMPSRGTCKSKSGRRNTLTVSSGKDSRPAELTPTTTASTGTTPSKTSKNSCTSSNTPDLVPSTAWSGGDPAATGRSERSPPMQDESKNCTEKSAERGSAGRFVSLRIGATQPRLPSPSSGSRPSWTASSLHSLQQQPGVPITTPTSTLTPVDQNGVNTSTDAGPRRKTDSKSSSSSYSSSSVDSSSSSSGEDNNGGGTKNGGGPATNGGPLPTGTGNLADQAPSDYKCAKSGKDCTNGTKETAGAHKRQREKDVAEGESSDYDHLPLTSLLETKTRRRGDSTGKSAKTGCKRAVASTENSGEAESSTGPKGSTKTAEQACKQKTTCSEEVETCRSGNRTGKSAETDCEREGASTENSGEAENLTGPKGPTNACQEETTAKEVLGQTATATVTKASLGATTTAAGASARNTGGTTNPTDKLGGLNALAGTSASGSTGNDTKNELVAGKARENLQVKRTRGNSTANSEKGAASDDSAGGVNSDDDHLPLSTLLVTKTYRKSRKVEQDTTTKRHDERLREERTRQEAVQQDSQTSTCYEGDTPTASKGQCGEAAHGQGVRSESRGQKVLQGEKRNSTTASTERDNGRWREGEGSPEEQNAPEKDDQGVQSAKQTQGDLAEAHRKAKLSRRSSE